MQHFETEVKTMKTKTFRALLSTTVFFLLLTLIAWTAVACTQEPLGNESESESESETESESDSDNPTLQRPDTESESTPAPGSSASGSANEEVSPSEKLEAMTEEVLSDLQKQLQEIRTMLLGAGEAAPLPYTYTLENGAVTITGYTGDEVRVTVPSTIEGHPVIAVGERAFSGTAVQCVILPDGVEKLDWFAFWQCTALSELHLPASVSSIGYAALDGCPSTLTLVCPRGSYAARYAASYGLPYLAP
jgi:hypothetical protein